MADTEHSQIREHHLNALLRMAYYRRVRPGGEKFPFIIWWLCKIDLGTLFSGAGSGGLVTSMLEHEAVPPPSFHLYPLGDDGSSMVFANERATLPQLLQLDYEITLLAIRLTVLAQEFRSDVQFGALQGVQRDIAVRLRQSRLYEVQDALRQLWMRPAILDLGQSPLAPRPQRIWEHAFSLYRACLIYLHTSMWPAQRLDTPPDFIEEISSAATEILQLAQGTIYDGHSECRFLVFPILLAGFASTNGAEKKLALDLVDRMQHDSVGRNTAATWTALQAIYQEQSQQFRNTGNSDDVDWFEVITQNRLTIVHFGL